MFIFIAPSEYIVLEVEKQKSPRNSYDDVNIMFYLLRVEVVVPILTVLPKDVL